jgi:hypothetical protein
VEEGPLESSHARRPGRKGERSAGGRRLAVGFDDAGWPWSFLFGFDVCLLGTYECLHQPVQRLRIILINLRNKLIFRCILWK